MTKRKRLYPNIGILLNRSLSMLPPVKKTTQRLMNHASKEAHYKHDLERAGCSDVCFVLTTYCDFGIFSFAIGNLLSFFRSGAYKMKFTWWLLQIFFLLISMFFTLFGVDILVGAYGLNNPFSFIMTFFAASFIILINLTFSVIFVLKMVQAYRRSKINGQED